MSYEFDSRIRYSETDEKGRLSITGLVNYFQDASTFQSEGLGVGIQYMKENRKAWVLSSWQIVIERMPELGEKVIAQTWPYEFNTFYGLRNFALLDEQRNYLAKANSIWALIDVDKQRPVRCGEDIIEKYVLEPSLDMDYAPRKIAVPEGGTMETSIIIGRHLLDTNHHVNNGQYIALAAAYLPKDFVIGQLRAEYRMQARLHDVMFPMVAVEGNLITVSMCNEKGRPYAVVEFTGKV